jgi:hypothetical protein
MTATVTLLVKLLGIGLEFPRVKFLFRRTVEKGARAIMTATPFHELADPVGRRQTVVTHG